MLCTRNWLRSVLYTRPIFQTQTVARYSTSSTSTPAPSQQQEQQQQQRNKLWMPVINLPVSEFAHTAFFSLDRPLLDLYNKDQENYVHDDSWTTSIYQPYQPPALPNIQNYSSNTTSSTTTITLNISRVGTHFQIEPNDILGQDQVADYLVSMQQKWVQLEQRKKRRSLARKRYLLRKRGFFEKN